MSPLTSTLPHLLASTYTLLSLGQSQDCRLPETHPHFTLGLSPLSPSFIHSIFLTPHLFTLPTPSHLAHSCCQESYSSILGPPSIYSLSRLYVYPQEPQTSISSEFHPARVNCFLYISTWTLILKKHSWFPPVSNLLVLHSSHIHKKISKVLPSKYIMNLPMSPPPTTVTTTWVQASTIHLWVCTVSQSPHLYCCSLDRLPFTLDIGPLYLLCPLPRMFFPQVSNGLFSCQMSFLKKIFPKHPI
jgi:hypothetical protein